MQVHEKARSINSELEQVTSFFISFLIGKKKNYVGEEREARGINIGTYFPAQN